MSVYPPSPQPQSQSGTAAPAPAEPDLDRVKQWVFICEASDCRYQGAVKLREALASGLAQAGNDVNGTGEVAVVRTGCLSLCGAGPAVVTYPAGSVLLHVEPSDARDLASSLLAGQPLTRRVVRPPQWYRDSIMSRLAYYVDLLKKRAAARATG